MNDTMQTHTAVTIGVPKAQLEACRAICDFEDTRVSTRTDVVIIDIDEHHYHLENNDLYESPPEAEAVVAEARTFNPAVRYVVVWNTG